VEFEHVVVLSERMRHQAHLFRENKILVSHGTRFFPELAGTDYCFVEFDLQSTLTEAGIFRILNQLNERKNVLGIMLNADRSFVQQPGFEANFPLYCSRQRVVGFRVLTHVFDVGCHLSARQMEVAALLSVGMRNNEVARILGVSYDTVRTHAKLIFTAMHLKEPHHKEHHGNNTQRTLVGLYARRYMPEEVDRILRHYKIQVSALENKTV